MIIDGRFVVSKGKVLTIDEEEVKQEVEKRLGDCVQDQGLKECEGWNR